MARTIIGVLPRMKIVRLQGRDERYARGVHKLFATRLLDRTAALIPLLAISIRAFLDEGGRFAAASLLSLLAS